MGKFKKIFPIYINTLNIFRPFKTWWKNGCKSGWLKPKIVFNNQGFEWAINNFYTWYWWDHPFIWNFHKKWLIVLIDDVQYKHTFGIKELESVPFIYIKIFCWNLLISFNAPAYYNKYYYWETIDKK